MGEQPHDNRNRYMAPKAMATAALIDLGGLAIADLVIGVSEKTETTMQTMGVGLALGAGIAALFASRINRR